MARTAKIEVVSAEYIPEARVIRITGKYSTGKILSFDIDRSSIGFAENIPDEFMYKFADIIKKRKEITWHNEDPPSVMDVLSDYEKMGVTAKVNAKLNVED